MAKLIKKNEEQFIQLQKLFHEMIAARHAGKRKEFEKIVAEIHEKSYIEVKDDE